MSRVQDSTCSSLLLGLRANDAHAWHRLLNLYSPLVYSWCRRSGMRPEDAADVLQEVFQAVFGNIDGFRHETRDDTFRGWLRVITRNKINDFFRRRQGELNATGGSDAYRRFLEVTEREEESSAEPSPIDGVLQRALHLIRAEFRTPTWQAFWLTVVEQRPAAEVAGALGTTPTAVRQAKSRILRRLRQELGDME